MYVHTTTLEGDGNLKINGGKGSSPGGGGGAGGAFYLVLKRFNEPDTFPGCTIGWKRGDPDILGGEGGKRYLEINQGGFGDPGFFVSTPC